MASTTSKVLGLLAALVAILVYFLKRNEGEATVGRLNSVLAGLLLVENQVRLTSKPRIAIGFGACVDLVVQATDVLKFPLEEHKQSAFVPEHFDVINSLEQLNKAFAYFFIHGAAAERYVGNSALFDSLVESSRSLLSARWALGGNGPLMGSRFAKEGSAVLLGASFSESLRKTLHADIQVTGKDLEKDVVHMSLEYPAGATWGPYTTPRANRLIIHSDHTNPPIAALESFEEKLEEFKPDLLVISGLHMMDNFPFPPGARRARVGQVQKVMTSRSNDIRIHFEMASFADQSLLQELSELIIPNADSLGMNEQELTNLLSILQFGNISLVSDARPRIASVLDQMRDLFRILQGNTEEGTSRPLTRLHVHTLAYQAIMTKKSSAWKHTRSAAAKAALTANRYVCGSTEVDVGKSQLLIDDSFAINRDAGSQRIPFDVEKPVPCWDEQDEKGQYTVEICLAPVLVCKQVVQTVGGGDNISSAGLVLQVL